MREKNRLLYRVYGKTIYRVRVLQSNRKDDCKYFKRIDWMNKWIVERSGTEIVNFTIETL